MLNLKFSEWDIILLFAVSTMSVILAYAENPKIKAFIFSLPIPFSIASLSLGRPVDTTNVMGLILLLAFAHSVRILHLNVKINIVIAIIISAIGYCVIGSILAAVIPVNEWTFWITFSAVIVLALYLYTTTPEPVEPGYKSPLPVWIKFPAVLGVVAKLVVIKNILQGFMTVFPMVGVVAAYESRYSLWTICRQVPVIMLTLGPMIAVIHVVQDYVPYGFALAIGWVIMLSILIPFSRNIWNKEKRRV